MQTTGVYAIVNLIDGKSYIGSSIKCKTRMGVHRQRLEDGIHENLYLQRAWNKYGSEQFIFVMVERCGDKERFIREQYWIDRLKTSKTGYNLAHSVASNSPSPHTSKLHREWWDEGQGRREAQAKNSRRQYKDPDIKTVRLAALAKGRDKTNGYWYDPDSKVRKARLRNLAKGSLALKKLMKDHKWRKSRRTGSRTKEIWERPEYREKCLVKLKETQKRGAAAIKDKWDNDPGYRKKRLAALRKSNSRPDFKKRHQEKLKKFWSDPEYRARHSARQKARWKKYREDAKLRDSLSNR